MNRGQVTGVIVGAVTIVFTIMATVIGGVWVVLGEIHKENAETRDKLGEQIDELRKENAETRENVKIIETKIDEFKVSHEREHDIFYGQGDQEDQGEQGSQADQ